VVLDCWAHQFNLDLITGNVLKLELPLILVADDALEVIKWFPNHSIPLGILNNEQQHSGTSATPLILILPVVTQWTSHFLAMDCLLALEVLFYPFKNGSLFQSVAGLWNIVCCTFKWFYNKNPDGEFWRNFTNYVASMGTWSDEQMSLKYHSKDAQNWNTFVNLVLVWREHQAGNSMDGANGMVHFAMHIESMVPNSASMEQFFSRITGTHTEVRNYMDAEKSQKIVVLKDHIQQKHGVPPTYK
ncbi:hypothetical protein BT96DRAFT_844344, partial [Gymnopus androsaceus JB14]